MMWVNPKDFGEIAVACNLFDGLAILLPPGPNISEAVTATISNAR
jgi:hypothetical protein